MCERPAHGVHHGRLSRRSQDPCCPRQPLCSLPTQRSSAIPVHSIWTWWTPSSCRRGPSAPCPLSGHLPSPSTAFGLGGLRAHACRFSSLMAPPLHLRLQCSPVRPAVTPGGSRLCALLWSLGYKDTVLPLAKVSGEFTSRYHEPPHLPMVQTGASHTFLQAPQRGPPVQPGGGGCSLPQHADHLWDLFLPQSAWYATETQGLQKVTPSAPTRRGFRDTCPVNDVRRLGFRAQSCCSKASLWFSDMSPFLSCLWLMHKSCPFPTHCSQSNPGRLEVGGLQTGCLQQKLEG